jgi:hypothetical protein
MNRDAMGLRQDSSLVYTYNEIHIHQRVDYRAIWAQHFTPSLQDIFSRGESLGYCSRGGVARKEWSACSTGDDEDAVRSETADVTVTCARHAGREIATSSRIGHSGHRSGSATDYRLLTEPETKVSRTMVILQGDLTDGGGVGGCGMLGDFLYGTGSVYDSDSEP